MYRRRKSRYQRSRSYGPKANWKGVFENRLPNPETLYTTVMTEFTSGEGWNGANIPGNLYVNTGEIWQKHKNSNVSTCFPHSIVCNDPRTRALWPSATIPTSLSWANKDVPFVDVNRWATYYNWCTVYELDIVLQVGSLFSLDSGWTGYLNGEDSYYLYYCLPNVEAPTDQPGTAYNPWGIDAVTTPVSTVMRTPKIRRVKLTTANTSGKDISCKLRIKFKLRDTTSAPDYMKSSVSGNSNGTAWQQPVSRNGFFLGTAYIPHCFYFWMGTDNTISNYNVQARWNMKLYAKCKFWEPRPTALAPRLTFATALDQPQEELDQDEMVEELPYESLPSTPLMEQLTRELQVLGHVPKKAKKL